MKKLHPKIKSIKAWAVINVDLNEICATGTFDEIGHELVNEGSAVFDSKGEAQQYRKQLDMKMCKVIPVKITPL